MTSLETASQSAQRRRVSSGEERRTATFRLPQVAQEVVASLEPGSLVSFQVGSVWPVFWVFSSKVLRHSAQTWLKQHLGSHE